MVDVDPNGKKDGDGREDRRRDGTATVREGPCEGSMIRIQWRSRARVCRRKLREHLLQRCREGGVKYMAGEVAALQEGGPEPSARCRLTLSDGTVLKAQCAPPTWPRLLHSLC